MFRYQLRGHETNINHAYAWTNFGVWRNSLSAVYHLSISLASGISCLSSVYLACFGIGFVLVLGRTWTGQLACLVNLLSSVSLNPTVDKIPVWLTDNSWICYRFSCLRKAWLKSMGVEVLNSCSRLAFLPKFQDLQCAYLQWKTNDRSLQGKERKAE